MPYELKLFTGNAHHALAEDIAVSLGLPVGDAEVSRFSDGEIFVQINENVRGADVFLVQPTCPPVNDNILELLIMLDALKRASAQRITAVLPYYGYARQDRKVQPRVPITAKLVADLIQAAGAERLLAIDLHAGQIQGFFDIPVDHLFAAPVIIDYIDKRGLSDLVVVSPDAGGVERARAIAKRLQAGLAIIDKRREAANVAVFMHLIGDVRGRDVLIIDDMIDTAGTLVQAADALKREGARRILACGVHPVLSGPALARIEGSPLEEVVVTNSIPLGPEKQHPKITVLSVAPLLAEAIRRIHDEESVSTLFV
jgi:ribose-phosphate pyrophosphokinase